MEQTQEGAVCQTVLFLATLLARFQWDITEGIAIRYRLHSLQLDNN